MHLKDWLVGRYTRLGLSLAVMTFVLDQASKWWLIGPFHLAQKQRVAVLPFLDLVYSKNLGISYGFFYGAFGPAALALFSALAALGLAVWLAHGATNRLMALAIGLIIGGALGNGLDRLTLGGVADFVLLHAYGYSWYIFNLADVAIVAGVIGLLYDAMVLSRPVDKSHAP